MKLLVQHGSDPTAEFGAKTPLELAQSLGQQDIVQFLEGEEWEREREQLASCVSECVCRTDEAAAAEGSTQV